ncbi:LysR family transcriptional regulator [Phyllobacterium leguminum]|uniref:LysR family transcriptional regulator for bpeEF and oprC n=1 Tax=Phyllobacterium leguminum TaxID=314237 RepID=A0A318T2H4_9HYPH|nr:LysR family transcriptional regulator [Phyllobacterium leguminum]PYE88708.1 LysR family transcriptional regulator for bpeEF and oprC [Phyllobacterium leguminum]
MDRFSSLQLFVRVVERGSFTHVGRELGLGQPAVSKQIAALEAHLGTQLLSRTSRGLHPTAAGQDFYESAIRILHDLEEAELRIGQNNVSPAGVVRLATPPALGRMYIIPRLPAFFARYPDVSIDLSVAERRVDLVREGIDIALRVGPLADSTLVARKIGDLHMMAAATPAYLEQYGTPSSPADLRSHNLIVSQNQGATQPWKFNGPDGLILFEPEGNFRTNDAGDQRAAVLAGLGIAYAGRAMFEADLRAGKMVPILEDFAPAPSPIHVICASGRRMPQRFRVVIDFLAKMCAEEPALRLAP